MAAAGPEHLLRPLQGQVDQIQAHPYSRRVPLEGAQERYHRRHINDYSLDRSISFYCDQDILPLFFPVSVLLNKEMRAQRLLV